MATLVTLDDSLKSRVQHLADIKHRTVQWIMCEAIRHYVEREERHEAYKQDALRAWEAYQKNGLYLTFEEADAWLAHLEADELPHPTRPPADLAKNGYPDCQMKQAIQEYLVGEGAYEHEKQEDLWRMQHYTASGERISHEEARTRLTELAAHARAQTETEAEHRKILKQALLGSKERSFAQTLAEMPMVGLESDFERI